MTPEQLYKLRTKFIKRYFRLFRYVLKEQAKTIVDYLEYQSYEHLLSNIDLLVKEDPIKETYIKLYQDVGKIFGQNVYGIIKSSNKEYKLKGLDDDLWLQMMRAWCIKECGLRITEVTAYSRELLISIVKKNIDSGITEGMSIRDISKLIQKDLPKEYAKTAAWRAQRIAQTEVISAQNMSGLRAAEATGLNLVKKWSTRPYGFAQSLQNERHAIIGIDLEGQRPKLDEPFLVNGELLMYPGDPSGSPSNVINCFCTMSYETI